MKLGDFKENCHGGLQVLGKAVARQLEKGRQSLRPVGIRME